LQDESITLQSELKKLSESFRIYANEAQNKVIYISIGAAILLFVASFF
jgi:hypothetical protein